MRRQRSDDQLCDLQVGPAPQSTLTQGQAASCQLLQDPRGCEHASTEAVRDPAGVLGAGFLGGGGLGGLAGVAPLIGSSDVQVQRQCWTTWFLPTPR